jgi:catechol 2,3-dioxygenase-like lactoylglutathione lyase family enzyme
MTAQGLPGLTGLDHVGFTVPDLDEAHAFLVDVLGCEYLYQLGPYSSGPHGRGPDWLSVHLGVDDNAVMRRLRFFSCAGKAVFEVFEYDTPDQVEQLPRNSDIGGHHVALHVEDLDAAVRHLRANGVTVMGCPTASTGPSEGQRWVYFRAPWGMQFELVSYPDGKAFDRPGYRAAPPS